MGIAIREDEYVPVKDGDLRFPDDDLSVNFVHNKNESKSALLSCRDIVRDLAARSGMKIHLFDLGDIEDVVRLYDGIVKRFREE